MDYPFEHPEFQSRRLALRTSGFFAAPRLVVDGAEVVGSKRKFSVHDDQGRPRELKLKAHFLDPIPKVVIDGTAIDLVRPLAWYEYTWMGLPILLVVSGGALGALFGMLAGYSSTRIFRSDRGPVAKYVVSGAISLGAVVGFLAIVTAIQLLIARNADPSSKRVLEEVARVSNQQLPKKIDDQTELASVEGLEGVLVYHYRLTKVLPGQISGEALMQRLGPTVSENACADPANRTRFLDHGVALRFVYSDSQGGTLAKIDVAGSDCP